MLALQPLPAGVSQAARSARAGENRGAALTGIERVQYHQPCIVGAAVGIHESAPVAALERFARDVAAQVDAGGGGEMRPRGQMIVDEQPRADQPGRPQVRGVRHDEVQRPHDVGRGGEQDLPLDERLAHQGEVILLEIAQPAVDQFGAGRGGVRCEVILLAQQNSEAASGGVARDAGAVDPAADDQQVTARRSRRAHARRGTCRP